MKTNDDIYYFGFTLVLVFSHFFRQSIMQVVCSDLPRVPTNTTSHFSPELVGTLKSLIILTEKEKSSSLFLR